MVREDDCAVCVETLIAVGRHSARAVEVVREGSESGQIAAAGSNLGKN
jgi:hypothetical protein